MKIISLNVEGARHLLRTANFFTSEMADVVCVQECTKETQTFLESIGYTTFFLPMTIKQNTEEGILIASIFPFFASGDYYFRPGEELYVFEKAASRQTNRQGTILASIAKNGLTYHIATTHFTWALHGNIPSPEQFEDMLSFKKMTATYPPHVMCGDFNIPRLHNELYAQLLHSYSDTIPHKYKSSLDADIHRLGNDPDKSIIFTDYMVDYLLTQSPYSADEVRLVFGVSDHAAIVGTCVKNGAD